MLILITYYRYNLIYNNLQVNLKDFIRVYTTTNVTNPKHHVIVTSILSFNALWSRREKDDIT